MGFDPECRSMFLAIQKRTARSNKYLALNVNDSRGTKEQCNVDENKWR